MQAQPPTLTLTAASSSVVVVQGAFSTMSFTVSTGGSFGGSIGLTVSGLPADVTAQWSANPLLPAASVSTNQVTLTLSASASGMVGSDSVVVTAAGNGLTAAQTLTLQVQARPLCSALLRQLRLRCNVPPRGLQFKPQPQ